MTASHGSGALRELLAQPGVCQLAPETPDGLMARMVALAGFELAFVGLAGSTLNRIGSPDAGLLTVTELVDNATRCIAASGLPTVVDAGTGFGNPMNVLRVVSELARAGAAAVLLYDGEDPRPYRTWATAIAAAEMQAKVKAARDVAGNLMVIAGIQGGAHARADLAERVAMYRDAGADLVHVGTVRHRAEAEALVRALPGGPLACNLAPSGELDAHALGLFGFRLALIPHCGLMASVPAIEHTFSELARTGTVGHLRPHIADFRQFTDIAGLPDVQKLEECYGVPDEQRTTL